MFVMNKQIYIKLFGVEKQFLTIVYSSKLLKEY